MRWNLRLINKDDSKIDEMNDIDIETKYTGLRLGEKLVKESLLAEEALEIYRDRDVVEKVFRSIKSEMDYSKFGVHSESSLIAKTHIIFIASIVRSVMGQQLKELYKKDRKRFTIPASLRELDKIEVTRNNKGRYIRKYALTSRQKQILKVFEIDEKVLDKMINEKAPKQ